MKNAVAIHPDGASIRPEEALRGLLGDEAAGARVVREDLLRSHAIIVGQVWEVADEDCEVEDAVEAPVGEEVRCVDD